MLVLQHFKTRHIAAILALVICGFSSGAFAAAPANDNFANATVLTGNPASASGTNVGATAEASDPAQNTGHHTVWYTYVSPIPGTFKLGVDSSGPNGFNAIVSVYTGSTLATLTLVPGASQTTSHAQISFVTAANISYSIAIDGSGGNTGPFKLAAAVVAAPANDNIANAIDLGSGATFSATGTTVGATLEPTESSNGLGNTVWYKWTANATRNVVINTQGSFDDIDLQVFSSNAPTAPTIGSLTNTAQKSEAIQFSAVAGTVYFIQIDPDNIESTFTINLAAPPVNDNLAAAIDLGNGTSFNAVGDDTGATIETDEDAFASIWYKWTAPTTGTIAVTLSTPSFHIFPVLHVYTNSVPANPPTIDTLAPVTINATSDFYYQVPVTQGTVYYFSLDDSKRTFGPMGLSTVPAPANDNFANAIDFGTVSSFSATGNNTGATIQTNEPGIGGSGATVWYKWTSPTARTVQIDTNGSAVLSRIGVFTGNLSTNVSLVQVAANTSNVANAVNNYYVQFAAAANTTYFIALDSGDQPGALRVNLLPTPANDNFANAAPISGNVLVAGNNTNATTETGEPNPGTASVWYAWTATNTSSTSFDIEVHQGFTANLTIYTGTAVGALTQVLTTTSGSNFNTTTGTTYYIAITGSSGGMGAFTFSIVPGTPAPTAPVNDNFANSITVSGATFNVAGTTVAASSEPLEPLETGKGVTVWYNWTAPSTGTFVLSAISAITGNTLPLPPMYLDVYTGSTLPTLSTVMSGNAAVTFNAVAGTVYQFRVDSTTGSGSQFALKMGTTPPNDNVANAIALTGNSFNVSGDSTGATNEPGESDNLGQTVWYTWTAPANSHVTIQATSLRFKYDFLVYTGNSFATFTPVTDTSVPTQFGTFSFDATQGVKYTIVIGGGGAGEFNLVLKSAPSNDNFAGSITVVGSLVNLTGSTIAASLESGEPTSNVGSHSVWYNWTAPASGPTQVAGIEIVGSITTLATNTAVYTGSALNALTLVTSGNEVTQFNAVAGTTYQITVSSDVQADFEFIIIQRPPNDDFVNAAILTGALPITTTGTTLLATLEPGEPAPSLLSLVGSEIGSVWYKYTATTTHRLDVNISGNSFISSLGVYTGTTVSSLAQVGVSGGLNLFASDNDVQFDAVAGTTYYIEVQGITQLELLQNFTLSISEANLAVTSALTATPVPAVAGEPVTFTVGTDVTGASYTWDFGDGSTTTTTAGTVTHAYATAGTYTANVVASVLNGTSVTNSIAVTVLAKKDLGLSKASIALNFAKPGTDAIVLGGTINLPPGLVAGQLTINVGSVSQTVTLVKGAFKSKSQTVKITAPKVGTANGKLAITLKGSFQAAFAAQGLTSAVVKGKAAVVPVQLIYNGVSSEFTLNLAYTSTGKKGVAK